MKHLLTYILSLMIFATSFSQVQEFKMNMSLIEDTSAYPFKRTLIRTYESSVEEDSSDYGALYTLSSLYFEIGEHDKSINALTYLVKKQPYNPNPVGNRAFRYFYSNQFALAKLDFDKAIELDTTDPVSFLNRAFFETSTEEYELAATDLLQAIKLRPDYAKAYANLGDTYKRMGKYEEALENCTKAIALKPAYVEAFLNRGVIYLRTEKYTEALKDFDFVLQLYPSIGIPDFFLNRGKCKYYSGNTEGAEVEFNKSIEFAYHSDMINSYAKYEVYNVKGEYKNALKELNLVILDTDDVPEFYENRAALYKKLKKRKAAKSDLLKAKELRENKVSYQ